ncbi:hypothetical protein Cgig2_008551 [Carnegiea gigantea]|uniref:DUF4216 domain-containing protein n=1 Tax=Carnegiea gigantea TaxID=171969 RepID=A0A9Q1GJI2_9CARY|nr:hypothetical protein Cgig2_008551 [Carnegiea gigantea]
MHERYKLVEVHHTKKYPKYDPFVLASQVQQVYFTPYPSTKNDKKAWWAVFKVKPRSTIDTSIEDIAFQEDVNDNPPTLSEVDLEEEGGEYEEIIDKVNGDGFEVDPKEGDCDQDEDETEDELEDVEEYKDQDQYDDEDEDDNAWHLIHNWNLLQYLVEIDKEVQVLQIEGGGNHIALLNYDKNQSPTGNAIVSHSASDRTGNLSAPQILSPEEHASLVKEKFYQKGQNRLKDLVCKVSKKKPEDPIPWLSLDVRVQLVQHKKTSRGFLKRSRQSMLNKITGPKARSHHTLGSVSTAEIAKRLRKARETPVAAKLFAKARVRAKDKSFSDDRSKAVWLQSELDLTKAGLNSTKNELQEQRQSMENQQRMMEEQHRQLEK